MGIMMMQIDRRVGDGQVDGDHGEVAEQQAEGHRPQSGWGRAWSGPSGLEPPNLAALFMTYGAG